MVAEAINTAIEAGPQAGNILVRGDSAFCAGKIIAAVVNAGARFSFAIARNPAVDAAIASIPDDAFVPVRYPGAVTDPDTSELISDAHVAEVEYTAFADTPYEITAWLVVRRVLDAGTQDPLFPVWRYHPFFTDNTEPVAQADVTHGEHAIVEAVWSDLIDGPWAHQPSGSFAANAAWTVPAAITHNLLRAAGTVTDIAHYAVARGATLRTHLINVAARFACPQRRPVLHLSSHWPRTDAWLALWRAVFSTRPPSPPPHAPRRTTLGNRPDEPNRAPWTPGQSDSHAFATPRSFAGLTGSARHPVHGSRLSLDPPV
jgi:Transposase DDE domain group 1